MTNGPSKPRLSLRRDVLCVAHEVSGAEQPEGAQMIMDGYSFCYPCGQTVLDYRMQEIYSMLAILRMFRDGVIEVTAA